MSKEESQEAEAPKDGKGGWITFPFILGSAFGMTLAASGVTANLTVYLIKQYNVKSIDAAQIGNIVNGCISLSPVAGAILSDAFVGCYPVIVFSTLLSLLSLVLVTLTAAVKWLRPPPCAFGSADCQSASSGQLAFLYIAIALTAAGCGGTRFNMLALGASQFDKPRDQTVIFNWFFVLIYAAGIIGTTVLVFIEDSISWTLGFGLSATANAAIAVVLLSGAKYYRKPAAQGSPFTGLLQVVVAAFRKWNVTITPANPSYYFRAINGGNINRAKALDHTPNGSLLGRAPTQSLRFLNRAAWICDGEIKPNGSVAKPWRLSSVEQVEDFKVLLRIFPLWSSSIFISVSISIQLGLTVLQALTMDRTVGPHFSVPASSFVVSSLASTAIALCLLDRFLLPLWHHLTRHTPTPLQRVGVGHFFNAAGMAASALVEHARARVVRAHRKESEAGWVVPMSALWLVVPLVLVGVGEAFHFPGQVALYYREFPSMLRNTSTGMIAVTIALGFYLSTAVIDLIRRTTGWLPDNINASRLEKVYWIVTVLTIANFSYYIACAALYRYQNPLPEEEEEEGRQQRLNGND
ncbi:protein NRT1/ PTR FAMILY 2.7-like [Zingiber officinale]|nr:protein NRT1/ PTR FAMILY 2.7-like [Zingiber officinale]